MGAFLSAASLPAFHQYMLGIMCYHWIIWSNVASWWPDTNQTSLITRKTSTAHTKIVHIPRAKLLLRRVPPLTGFLGSNRISCSMKETTQLPTQVIHSQGESNWRMKRNIHTTTGLTSATSKWCIRCPKRLYMEFTFIFRSSTTSW